MAKSIFEQPKPVPAQTGASTPGGAPQWMAGLLNRLGSGAGAGANRGGHTGPCRVVLRVVGGGAWVELRVDVAREAEGGGGHVRGAAVTPHPPPEQHPPEGLQSAAPAAAALPPPPHLQPRPSEAELRCSGGDLAERLLRAAQGVIAAATATPSCTLSCTDPAVETLLQVLPQVGCPRFQ